MSVLRIAAILVPLLVSAAALPEDDREAMMECRLDRAGAVAARDTLGPPRIEGEGAARVFRYDTASRRPLQSWKPQLSIVELADGGLETRTLIRPVSFLEARSRLLAAHGREGCDSETSQRCTFRAAGAQVVLSEKDSAQVMLLCRY